VQPVGVRDLRARELVHDSEQVVAAATEAEVPRDA
jgi:hypothetical protein